MQVTKTVEETRKQIKAWKKEGKTIGLVPTMGFLHEGHASLIKKCREQNDIVVVSDFVNPTQFGPTEDLEAYPRDFERDSKLCESLGTDLIFCPEPSEMYHDPHAFVSIDTLSETLCGKTRPIHFKGVCTVVTKLFHIVAPDRAYFGQKDAQQLAIIRKMVQDLNFDIEIVGCPIVREEDGLAKSSRNTYLSDEERKAALCLSRSVKLGQEIIHAGISAEELLGKMRAVIEAEPLAKIDYVSMVDALTMQPVEKADHNVLVAMAVYIGKTRLIELRGIIYGKYFKENRKNQQFCIQIYWNHHHCLFMPCLFLEGWICMDDKLYICFSGRDHVWYGTDHTSGRLPGNFFQTKGSDHWRSCTVYDHASRSLGIV